MKLPEYGCQLSCERKSENQKISCTKGGRLGLQQVPAGKLCFTLILFIYILGTTQLCCSSSGVVVTHTLERILFFGLGLAVNTKNKEIKM